MQLRKPAPIVVLALLGFAPAAQATQPSSYVLRHPHRERCRAGYARHARTIHRDSHGRRLTVHQTVCTRKRPVAKPVVAPITKPAVKPALSLKARIDPSFTQSPTNPLAVTYAFSAGATEHPDAGVERPVALPPGILNLYSDGSLECSVNVGGSATGGTCPVTYSSLGAHKVIVDYVSGEASATETSTEQINPYSTTTRLALSAPRGCVTEPELERCTYTAETSTLDQNGNIPAEGSETLLFVLPGAEFSYGFDSEEMGQPRGSFIAPVTFTLTRTHTEAGWTCAISSGSQVQYIGPVPWEKYWATKCGTTLEVSAHYWDIPQGGLSPGWTSSEVALIPVAF